MLILLVQGVTRFAVQPAVGFVLDDWAYWAQTEKFSSATDTLVGGLRHPLRPFLHGVQLSAHWALGDHLAAFGILSAAGYSLALLLFFLFLEEVTKKKTAALGGALLFAVLPNLCGHFHWLCVAVAFGLFGQPMYLLSAWALARYARRNGKHYLALSALCYFFGIGTYEVGVFLPLAYGVLLWGRGWRKWLADMAPFGIALGIYAAWRVTFGFGWGWSWFGIPPQTSVALSLYGLKHTLAGVVSWWCGFDWWRAVGDGITGFAELPWERGTTLVLANALLLGLTGWVMSHMVPDDTRPDAVAPFTGVRLTLFGAAWIGATYLPAFLGYLVPRINYLPGAGMAFLAALAMGRIRRECWLPLLCALAFEGMVVGEGDTKNWADSIRFHRNLYETMKETRGDWENKDILWIDTRALTQRRTPGILTPNRHHIDTISDYRNAGFLRGFAPSAMAQLILKGTPGPQVMLDVECGAHREGETLFWHERYNPDAPRQTSMERVFCIDALEAGTCSPVP